MSNFGFSKMRDLIEPPRAVNYSVEIWGNESIRPRLGSLSLVPFIFGNDFLWDEVKSDLCPLKYRITVEQIPPEMAEAAIKSAIGINVSTQESVSGNPA